MAAHVDLTIHAGEFVAVLGPNGSGKSTLVKGLLGLVEVLAGDVEWYGSPLAPRSGAGRVRAAASDGGGADPGHRARSRRSRRRVGSRWWRRQGTADRAAVVAAIEVVGLADEVRTPVGQLSGGQQRRAMVARGLASGAEVLVLDEPPAGVDARSQAALAGTLHPARRAGRRS